jgi:hypothetical protein
MKTLFAMLMLTAAMTSSAHALDSSEFLKLPLDGNKILMACAAPPRSDGWIYCFSFMQHAMARYGACIPASTSDPEKQVIDVTVSYLRKHPEKLHLHPYFAMAEAWNEAWPSCHLKAN